MFWPCGNTQPLPAVAIPAEELGVLRAEVREIIRPECGSCHTSTLPTAKPGAVAAFDLEKDDWSASMNAEQLHSFGKRLSDFKDSSRVQINKLISAELARR
jgi:mono/diheme cytochrome c family protein